MEWISVKDRLPQEIIEYVLVGRDNRVCCAMEANYINGEFVTYRFGDRKVFKDPTHWMPIPIPLEKEDES